VLRAVLWSFPLYRGERTSPTTVQKALAQLFWVQDSLLLMRCCSQQGRKHREMLSDAAGEDKIHTALSSSVE